MEGEVRGGESQLLPGVSRRPGGERHSQMPKVSHGSTCSRTKRPISSDPLFFIYSFHQSFVKGIPPRQNLLPTGGTVLTTEEKYMVMVDKCFPDDTSE